MDASTSAIYHVLVLFLLSSGVFSLKRTGLITPLLMIPVLGETVQFFIPGRTPDFMDLIHGYLGIVVAYCLVQMWRELKPALKQVQLELKKKVVESH